MRHPRRLPPLPATPADHPRSIGVAGTVAMAVGGSNQSLFIIGALLLAQGTATVPLLAVGLVLSWAALPGWTELVCMFPNRVGGIAAACAEAFRPYSPVLATLTGVSYWWGWIPTCGLTALLAASAFSGVVPGAPVHVIATAIVCTFAAINLFGIRLTTRAALLIASISGALAVTSAVAPVLSGGVAWQRAAAWRLAVPFHGAFGAVTSAMAGLYLIGFAAPAFEAAACHVGETVDPGRNVPRSMFAAAGVSTLYFVVLPVVWLGAVGAGPLSGDLTSALGPTFSPLAGPMAHGMAVAFLVFNMFHGTLQPLAGAARTLSQLADDGLLPSSLRRRNRHDVPVTATALTAAASIVFLLFDDPSSVIAAANFTYLIGIGLPSVAVLLLRRNHPDWLRPWRAPRGTVVAGVVAAAVWGVATVFGFEQFGLSYVLLALGMAYSGAFAYGWRRWRDLGRRTSGLSLHAKLTGAMVAVMALDGVGYLLAVHHVAEGGDPQMVTVLKDIFVAVALLTVSVGLVLPGIISHAVGQVGAAARQLTTVTLAELVDALDALGAGRLDRADLPVATIAPIEVRSSDEVGDMARDVAAMQRKVAAATAALGRARDQLEASRAELEAQARLDPLTGLGNRRALDAELGTRIGHLRRYGGSAALVLIDLDDFKVINDTRGHGAGDQVLMQVSQVLGRRMRSTDFLARLGGDEFAIVLPAASEADAAAVAGELIADIDDRTMVVDGAGRRLRVRASAGVVAFGGALTESSGTLLADADVALYAAKDSGRNRVAIASGASERRAQLAVRQEWTEVIREALAHDRFELWAQPIADVSSGLTVGHELLLRLRRGDEVVTPDAFLGVAERSGLIGSIDTMVVRKAVALVRAERALGRAPHFSVNLSGASMTDPGLVQLIEAELAGSDDGRFLTFEVTETAAISNIEQAREFAHRLRGLGCSLALDDFGSGFGSFYYLKHLPFTSLKIDGDFVRRLPDHPHDQHIVAALVEIAHGLGLATVAEYVEDGEVLAILGRLGVDRAQGYFVGRPAPLPAATAPARSQVGPAVDASRGAGDEVAVA